MYGVFALQFHATDRKLRITKKIYSRVKNESTVKVNNQIFDVHATVNCFINALVHFFVLLLFDYKKSKLLLSQRQLYFYL